MLMRLRDYAVIDDIRCRYDARHTPRACDRAPPPLLDAVRLFADNASDATMLIQRFDAICSARCRCSSPCRLHPPQYGAQRIYLPSRVSSCFADTDSARWRHAMLMRKAARSIHAPRRE